MQDRVSELSADYSLDFDERFESLAYLLRLPTAGGHWIAVLNPHLVLPVTSQDHPEVAAILCDSLYAQPFGINSTEMSELLLACAMESASTQSMNDPTFTPEWCCFLVGKKVESGPVSMLERWQDETW